MPSLIRHKLAVASLACLLVTTVMVVFGGGLGPGASGASVRRLQQDLAFLGYLPCLPTGYYGAQTKAAVKAFQLANSLTPDGIAGPKTLSILAQRVREKGSSLSSRRNDAAGLLPWEEVDRIFPRGSTARVWDVESHRSFWVWRLQGSYHADVEPLTRADSTVLLEISGGHWSKARRAALVEIQGRLVAASMYPFPHGHEAIHDNGFNGQFCLHFLGSRVHMSGRVDPTHQQMILRAAQAFPDWQAPATAPAPASAPAETLPLNPPDSPGERMTGIQ